MLFSKIYFFEVICKCLLFYKIMAKSIPLIVILGGTGTGKSRLAIEIAKKLGSEIISADSMQVYKGLDILTNKVTVAERAEVKHHLIDFVSPLNNFTVVNFRDKSLPIIEALLKSGKPPVVVGGTNYYIESLLWCTLVNVEGTKENEFFSDNRDDLIFKICHKLGITPVSKGIKRKVDELNITPADKKRPILNGPYELFMLRSYCNKILKSVEDILISEGCNNKVNDIFYNLIDSEFIYNIESKIKSLKEHLNDCKVNESECLFQSITFCLTLKNDISLILSKLHFSFNDIISNNNCSFERNIKNHNLDSVLLSIEGNIQKLNEIIGIYIPQDVNFLEKESERDINLTYLPSQQLHELLKNVDPERASSLHPNDRRKIVRSLEVWAVTGRKHSDIILEQQCEGSALGGPLRFTNTIIFWLTADPEILNKRLDERVDQMLDHGLVKELLDFYAEYHPKGDDFTRGIFQSIGFKEFREFLLLNDDEKFGEVGKKKLRDGIETLKLVTRRYVKYQNKWIKNRFLKYPDRDVPPVYKLDTSDVEHWDELVFKPAMDVIMSTIEGKSVKLKPLPKEKDVTKDEIVSMKSGHYYCEDCKRTFIGLLQWNSHINSIKHRKVISRKKQEAQNTTVVRNENAREIDNLQFESSGAVTDTSS